MSRHTEGGSDLPGSITVEAEGDRRILFLRGDIDAAVVQVRSLGGRAGDPSPEEPGFGRFSTCTDDQGIPFGLRQPPAPSEP